MKAQIYLYNLKSPKGLQIEALCLSLNIVCKHIAPADYLESIGYIVGIGGFSSRQLPFTGIPFVEEMMILHNFDNQQLDTFLASYRQAGIAPIILKAGTTPTNIHWNSLQLYEELQQERRAFEKK